VTTAIATVSLRGQLVTGHPRHRAAARPLGPSRSAGAGRHLRVIALSGTVDARPCLSHSTVAVPAFGSTDWTLPISPVAFLRTCPGASGPEVFSTGRRGFRGADVAGRGGRARLGGGASFLGSGCARAFSSGTT
jgi:hypothetical protein